MVDNVPLGDHSGALNTSKHMLLSGIPESGHGDRSPAPWGSAHAHDVLALPVKSEHRSNVGAAGDDSTSQEKYTVYLPRERQHIT